MFHCITGENQRMKSIYFMSYGLYFTPTLLETIGVGRSLYRTTCGKHVISKFNLRMLWKNSKAQASDWFRVSHLASKCTYTPCDLGVVQKRLILVFWNLRSCLPTFFQRNVLGEWRPAGAHAHAARSAHAGRKRAPQHPVCHRAVRSLAFYFGLSWYLIQLKL